MKIINGSGDVEDIGIGDGREWVYEECPSCKAELVVWVDKEAVKQDNMAHAHIYRVIRDGKLMRVMELLEEVISGPTTTISVDLVRRIEEEVDGV